MKLTPEEIDDLADQAWDHIQNEDYDAARKIGEKLKAAGIESGFRIVAMASAMEEEFESALGELKAGIERFPGAWQLHLQLGNFLSDTENYKEAIESFDKASTLPDAEKHWIEINKAVVYYRMKNFDQALNTLQKIEEPSAINNSFELQLRILDEIGRHDIILEMAEEELEYLQTPEDENAAAVMSRICTFIANAYWYEEENDPAEHYLNQAIAYDRTNPEAPVLMREMKADFSDTAKIFSLMVSGELFLDMEDQTRSIPFFTTYAVVAENQEEALEMIREYEPEHINSDSLKIIEAEETDNEDQEPKGIYLVGGLAFVEEDK